MILNSLQNLRLRTVKIQFKTVHEWTETSYLILVTGLIALIVIAIGIPQIIITLKQKDQGALEAEIKTLREKIELAVLSKHDWWDRIKTDPRSEELPTLSIQMVTYPIGVTMQNENQPISIFFREEQFR